MKRLCNKIKARTGVVHDIRKIMWGFVEKCSCVKIWRRVLTLPVAMLSMRSLDFTTVLYSNSYYTVVASIFLISAASCKAIYKVTSVRTSDYSQPFWLKWHALLMPHVLIKYAHVLICISAGEGSGTLVHFIYCLVLPVPLEAIGVTYALLSKHNTKL